MVTQLLPVEVCGRILYSGDIPAHTAPLNAGSFELPSALFRQLPASDTAKLREEIKQNLLNVNPVIKVPPTPAILHPMPVCPTCEQVPLDADG